jgi:NTP pyrophosphatase (non-canonical NTP hydrolase)
MFDKSIHWLREACSTIDQAIQNENDGAEPLKSDILEINDTIAFLKNAQIGGFGALVAQVRQWGVDKGLTGPKGKATVQGQLKKLEEEFEELKEGIEKKDQHEIIDAVGDMTVVLILLSNLAGFKFETALRAAYDVIKHRTGRMAADGTFVKDA